MTQFYRTREFVSYCRFDDGIVFADLSRDRYSLLPESGLLTFDRLLAGIEDNQTQSLAQRLVDQKLVAPDPSGCMAEFVIPNVERATEQPVGNAGLLPVAFALLALFRADFRLKRRSLKTVLTDLYRRRERSKFSVIPAVPKLMEIERSFRRASLVRSANDRCLNRSVALFDALVRAGAQPELIFGVALRPFAAHAWVTVNNCLIGDTLDRVRIFRPIAKL